MNDINYSIYPGKYLCKLILLLLSINVDLMVYIHFSYCLCHFTTFH